jgi:Dioxygenases related to 2-nitropropane dioxygenase
VRIFEEEYQEPIPVIAAGGIYTGADIQKFLQLGAAGVQMATRFITTNECDADIGFKRSFLNLKQEDLPIIKSPVGLLGRAIKNQFITDVGLGKKKPFHCPSIFYSMLVTCLISQLPPLDEQIKYAGIRYTLVTVTAKRAHQIIGKGNIDYPD